jgi:chemotaxis protein methyltransferase CheR
MYKNSIEERFDTQALQQSRTFIYEKYGIYFEVKKLFSLKYKLARRMRVLECDSLKEYLVCLDRNPDEIPLLLDEISTNKTYFFREPQHWNFLKQEILPALKPGSHNYHVWSVACSTGEEPYSAAMLMDNFRRWNPGNFSFRILGTDLSQGVLKQAIQAIYNEADIKKVRQFSKEFVTRYFEKNPEGSGWRIKKNIQKLVFFRQFNLREENYPVSNKFDLIICRNVLIYFDAEMISHTINELTKALKPGGYLFTGHTEPLNNIRHCLTKVQPAIYKKNDG